MPWRRHQIISVNSPLQHPIISVNSPLLSRKRLPTLRTLSSKKGGNCPTNKWGQNLGIGLWTRGSHSRDTKIFKLTEILWLSKSFIAQVVVERGQQQQAILHKLDLMDKKIWSGLQSSLWHWHYCDKTREHQAQPNGSCRTCSSVWRYRLQSHPN